MKWFGTMVISVQEQPFSDLKTTAIEFCFYSVFHALLCFSWALNCIVPA